MMKTIDGGSVTCSLHLHITVSEGELVRLAREGTSYIRRNLRLGFPDTVSAVRRLRQIGIRLNAASGDSSHDLAEYLGTMGIRDQFDRLYGTDLIDTAKASPAYYRAILADSRADSARSAVVDDSVRCLNWARECGLATYLMAPNGAESDHPVVRSLTELVDRLAP